MTDITRRGFLTGVATAVAGGVIVSATAAEVAAFTDLESRVSVLAQDKPFIMSGAMAFGKLSVGQQLFDEHRRVVAVVQAVQSDWIADEKIKDEWWWANVRQTATVVSV